jgi:hypothetical protein
MLSLYLKVINLVVLSLSFTPGTLPQYFQIHGNQILRLLDHTLFTRQRRRLLLGRPPRYGSSPYTGFARPAAVLPANITPTQIQTTSASHSTPKCIVQAHQVYDQLLY